MLNNTATLPPKPPTRHLTRTILLCVALLSAQAISQNAPPEDQTQSPPPDAMDSAPKEKPDKGLDPTTETAPVALGPGQQYRYGPRQQQTLIETELASSNPRGKIVWLTANETDFLALWNKDKSGNPQGAVLILPSENINPASQHKLSNIQSYLSENGWSTLTLSMPKQLQQLPPERPAEIIIKPKEDKGAETQAENSQKEDVADTDPKESTTDESKVVYDDSAEDQSEGEVVDSSETNNTAAPTMEPSLPPPPAEPEALARIMAGIRYLHDNKQFNNIVLANGISAARIVRAMHSDEVKTDIVAFKSIRGLILLNSLEQLKEIPEFDFLSGFEKISVPTLDILESASGRADLDIAMQNLARRKSAAKASNIPVYLSRKIQPAQFSTHGELRLTRIIRGFLYQHAQGMER